MSRDSSPPDFNTFVQWLASSIGARASTAQSEASQATAEVPGQLTAPDIANDQSTAGRAAPGASAKSERYDTLLAAARVARDEMLRATAIAQPNVSATGARPRHLEVLQLLAAADKSDSSRPPELTTARGFRVTLAYDEGAGSDTSSICVLVRCPPELIEAVQGETAFLWNGSERFELGQFDSEGKAIGTLPAGIEISLSDFALGKVKLEEPPPTTDG